MSDDPFELMIKAIRDPANFDRLFKSEEQKEYWRRIRVEQIKDALVRRVGDDTQELQVKYRGCAQTTLAAIVNNVHPGGVTDPWQVLPGMTTLCFGVANTQEGVCGALVGALYSIGMEFGRKSFFETGGPREGGPSAFMSANDVAQRVLLRFKKEMGGVINCNDIRESFFGFPSPLMTEIPPSIAEAVADGFIYDFLSIEAMSTCRAASTIAAEIILEARGVTPWLPVDAVC